MKWLIDDRWYGPHGIGRFAEEVNRRLCLAPAHLPLKPTHPLDAVLTTVALMLRPSVGFFSPGYNSPFFGLGRVALVVHDLNHIDVSHNSGILKRVYYGTVLKRACRKAAVVLTVSQFTATRISQWAGVSLDKITVVGNGVSEAFRPEGDSRSKGRPYFFCVGNRKGHKNELRVIQAFAEVRQSSDVVLLFNGNSSVELVDAAARLGVLNDIEFVGRLDESELAACYRGAIALVFPSLYEGFGLPVVEAMACGTPVITSTVTSLPEIAGDAALLVNALSVEEISQAMLKLYSSSTLRQELRERGIVRAKQFSWDDVASKVAAALETAGVP